MSKNDGGPAYPQKYVYGQGGGGVGTEQIATGMSLRDWFAGQAMMGLISADVVAASDFRSPEDFERIHSLAAYRMADAMLKEREK